MKLLALCIALLALAAEPAAAKISVYSLPAGSSPFDLTSSPDGSMWASETGADKLARVTPSGQVSQVALPAGSGPLGMSFGATGDVLVAAHGSGKLLHVSTSDGSVKSDELDGQRLPYEVAVSQGDGEPWVTAQPPTAGGGLTQGAIVKSSYCCGPTVYPLTGASVTVPYGITNGFNQSMWFTEQRTISEPGYIGRITTNGQITEFPIGPGAAPMDIAQGNDGNLWFTDGNGGRVGRVTSQGQITEFRIGASSQVLGIARAPSQAAVVVADPGTRALYVVKKDGKAQRVSVPGSPRKLAEGSNGMWFTMAQDKVGRIDDGDLEPACRVPRVVGLKLAAAKAALVRADCRLGHVTRRKHRGRKGIVLAQSPKPGKQRFAEGFRVDVTISR